MFLIQLKMLLKSKVRLFLILIIFGMGIADNINKLNYFKIEDIAVWGADGFLFSQLKICYFYFVFMVMLAFDYFSEIKRAKVDDVISSQGREIRTNIEMGGILLIIPVCFQICMTVFSVIAMYYSKAITEDMVWYLIKLWGCYATLCGVMAIALGCFLSKWKRRILGYVAIVLFCLMISFQVVANLMSNLGYAESILGKIMRVFYVMPFIEIYEDGSVWVAGPGHLYPIESYQVAAFVFWIGLSICGIAYCDKLKKKSLIIAISGVCSVVCLGRICLYSPNEYMCNYAHDDTDSSGEISGYYFSENECLVGSYEESTYNVSSYDLQVTPGWQMDIKATMQLENVKEKTYKMTLYHLFKIKSITDLEGNKLEFERDGDYITISSEERLNGITIHYYGGGPHYYCNNSNISLIGTYPYYPIAGYTPLYDENTQCLEDCSLDDSTSFDITIYSKQRVYCNLPEVEKNHFVGKTKAVALVSGFYRSKQMENGVTCVYTYLEPYIDPKIPENTEVINKLVEYMIKSGKWENTNGKTIILSPSYTSEKYMDDAIITNQSSWMGLYKSYCNCGEVLDEEALKFDDFSFYFNSEVDEQEKTATKEKKYMNSYEELQEIYSSIYDRYNGVTEEEFDAFIIEHFGEERLRERKGE